jgi:uncharacterized RDD family membrane protein YckC
VLALQAAVFGLLIGLARAAGGVPESQANATAALIMVLSVLSGMTYEVALLSRRGATVGKKVMGVRVAMLADGSNPSVGTCTKRLLCYWVPATVGLMLALIPGIVVMLSPLFDQSGARRGWWDKAAGTVVIRTR